LKLKIEGHQVPPGNLIKWIMLSVLRPPFWVQFVNETDVPIKIVSGTVGWRKTNLKFVQDVLPHSSHAQGLAYSSFHTFSSGGYLIIYLNGMLNPNSVRPEGDVRVVEFAMSGAMLDFFSEKINIRDITSGEFLSGSKGLGSSCARQLFGRHFE